MGIVIDPTDSATLYAAGAGGAVYTSQDGGETWSTGQRLAPPHCSFTNLAIDAEGLYVANPCTGLFKSSDAGHTWSHADAGLDNVVNLWTGSPHAPGLLLASSDDGQVYRSRDGAITWEPLTDGLPAAPLQRLTAAGPEIYWAVTAKREGETLYRFDGTRWSAFSLGNPPDVSVADVLVAPDDPDHLYIALQSVSPNATSPPEDLLHSIDGGLNWAPLPARPDKDKHDTHNPIGLDSPHLLGVIGAHTNTLYVADAGGVWAWSIGATTWTPVSLPQEAQPALIPAACVTSPRARGRIIADHSGDVLYLPLGGHGLAKSKDGGQHWHLINQGLNSSSVAFIAPHPSDPTTLYAASADSGDLFVATDYGERWTRLDQDGLENDRPVTELSVIPSQPKTLYQLTADGQAWRSKDGGTTWSAAWPGFRLGSVSVLATGRTISGTLYAEQPGKGLFRSDDGGRMWRHLPQAGGTHAAALAVHPNDPHFVLRGETPVSPTATISAPLRHSQDGGVTWDTILEVPDATGITAVALDPRVEPYFPRGKRPDNPTRLYAANSGPRGRLWYSDDAGETWKPLNKDLNFTDVRVLVTAPRRPGVVFAGVWGGGTWRSDDSGESWQRLHNDPALSAAAIAVDPSNYHIIYIADATMPRLYRSTDDGATWTTYLDAGPDYTRLVALALSSTDPHVLYASATREDGTGTILRVTAQGDGDPIAVDVTGDLPTGAQQGAPSSMAVHPRDPRRLYVTLQGGGAWKTLDANPDATWRQVKQGLPETSFYQIAIDPQRPETLYLTGGHSGGQAQPMTDPDEIYGIWRSDDDGNTWRKIGGDTLGRASGPIENITFHPDNERVLYAAGQGGIYLSPDRGETWTSINGRLPPFSMHAVAADEQTLYAGSGGAGAFSGPIHPLIHTADWTRSSHLNVPIAHIQIALHPKDPQIFYATAYPGGVFKTVDGGATWGTFNAGLPSFAVPDPTQQGYYALAIAPSDPKVLYLGLHGHGVYRSDNGTALNGLTPHVGWHPVWGADQNLQATNVTALWVHPQDPDTVLAGTDRGLWRTEDGGNHWHRFDTGLPPDVDVRALAMDVTGRIYAGTAGYEVYAREGLATDTQAGWQQLPALGPPPAPTLLPHPTDPDVFYAGNAHAGLYKTRDGGASWHAQDAGLGNAGVLALTLHPQAPEILYAGTTHGIAQSVDAGATWHPWDIGWPEGHAVLSIAIDPADPKILYACSQYSGNPAQGGLVMKSTDGGANWTTITTGLESEQTFHQVLVDHLTPNLVYLVTGQDGVFLSHDGGANWSSWNEGLWSRVAGHTIMGKAHVLQLSANGRLLYFGTAGSGVWRRPAAGAP